VILRANGVASILARAAISLATLGTIATWSCRPLPRAGSAVAPVAGREILVTESEIARLSVRTAWDVVRLRAPRLTYGQDAQGQPSRVMIQSQRSINADETPLLVVDGMRLSDIGYLSAIPASDVHAIHILESEDAEPLYGLSAAGGAIVVETKRGRRAARRQLGRAARVASLLATRQGPGRTLETGSDTGAGHFGKPRATPRNAKSLSKFP